MCHCDDNPPEIFNQATVKSSRKEHKCSECRRVIRVGESYLNSSGVWDGEFSRFKWCDHCCASQQIHQDAIGCSCYTFTNLWDDIAENRRDDIRIARIVWGYRRKWTVRRGPRKGQLMLVPSRVVATAKQGGAA